MGELALEEEPPALSLPAPAKFGYPAAASLPVALGFAQPSVWPVAIQQEPAAYGKSDTRRSSVGHGADGGAGVWDELKYVRKAAGRTPHFVPAPLYFRQTAAAVHSSPMLGPSSPAVVARSPTARPASHRRKGSFSSLHNFSLPPSMTWDNAKAPIPTVPAANCGRPGCVGAPAPRRSGASSPALRPTLGSSGSLHHLGKSDNDLLMSPRIRALRSKTPEQGHSSETEDTPEARRGKKAAEAQHSAFACYLFSHLNDTSHPKRVESDSLTTTIRATRGRTSTQSAGVPDRSLSVDSVLAASRTPSMGRSSRLTTGRGSTASQSRPRLERLSTLDDEDDVTVTIRASPAKSRPSIIPGHFISATTDSPLVPSNFPSASLATPMSPPTCPRGRSHGRRLSNSSPADYPSAVMERGRSHARLGATHRSQSRHREDSHSRGRDSGQNSRSRAREEQSRGRVSRACSPEPEERHSRSRGRVSRAASPVGRDSRSRAREERSRGRVSRAASPVDKEESRGSTSRGRLDSLRGREGRGDAVSRIRRERTVTECTEPAEESEEESDDSRGRGRRYEAGDSRSRSAIPRGRGRDSSP